MSQKTPNKVLVLGLIVAQGQKYGVLIENWNY